MARDYVDLLRRAEAHIPQSTGGTSQDDTLRASLVNFANDLFAELDREQRWSLSYAEPTFTTVSGTESYALPFPTPTAPGITSQLTISRVYYEDSTGRPRLLERYARQELQRVYGDGAAGAPTGAPTKYCIEPNDGLATTVNFGAPAMRISLYPTPDAAGPTSGNYVIRVGGYWSLPPIVETTGSTTAASTTLTVPSGTAFLVTANGLPTDGTGYGLGVSIRGAGALGVVSAYGAADTHITSWSAIGATTVTLSVAAVTLTTSAQCFFNSQNWLITHWPKVVLFGMMREVASYYGSTEQFQIWEARFQDQRERMRAYEFDRQRGLEQLAVSQVGQLAPELRRIDTPTFIDVRGGSI